jgi:hypothetical protein
MKKPPRLGISGGFSFNHLDEARDVSSGAVPDLAVLLFSTTCRSGTIGQA